MRPKEGRAVLVTAAPEEGSAVKAVEGDRGNRKVSGKDLFESTILPAAGQIRSCAFSSFFN